MSEQVLKQHTSQPSGKVIYTAKAHTTGGRENGVSRSSDGRLDVKLSMPGSSRIGTNPEQLFAAGWSACFEGAIGFAAQQRKINVGELAIDAEVNLHMGEGGFAISAAFNISMPDLDRETAKSLIEAAEKLCPYSKVTRGNIDVAYNLV
jgi:lipoyl-dependent peroxiredoxin